MNTNNLRVTEIIAEIIFTNFTKTIAPEKGIFWVMIDTLINFTASMFYVKLLLFMYFGALPIVLEDILISEIGLKGQYRHDQSRLSTGHGISVLV